MDLIYVENDLEMRVTLKMIESQKMTAHPYNATRESLARYLLTIVTPIYYEVHRYSHK